MKKTLAFIAFILSPFLSHSQANDKIANDAYVITWMVNKFHVQPRLVDDSFSADVFSEMLEKSDNDKMFFTKPDLSNLGVYTKTIDDEIKQRKTNYLSLFTKIYAQRLKQADSIITEIGKKPFDLITPDKFTVAESAASPLSVAGMQQKIYKKIKGEVVYGIINSAPVNFSSFAAPKQKKYTDSAEVVERKRICLSIKRKIGNILQNPYGITQYVGNLYCETIASCFDPHTEFFPPEKKETFESALGKQAFRFGFTINADKNSGVVIDKLQPGSPAFKGGKLNKGDKFISLQWEGGQPVDVSAVSVDEISALMAQSDHKKIVFTMKKANGAIVQVPMAKEQVNGGSDDKVKSFILKGDNTIGYIYLPAFYEDWDANADGLNGCANDVGREILKLKKENVNGIILDLRYNGGGSAKEATELTGIFIDAGPVEQAKDRSAKVYTMKDVNRGTIYDGPLAILVNGYSASASELVAGSLQDYNRAMIIGSPTYGKATSQVVLPMDTTVTQENFTQKHTENYLKVTVSKLYRLDGTTAQFTGVTPDVIVPDILDAYTTKEADAHFALQPNVIEANKYYTAYTPLPTKALALGVQTEIDTNKYFRAVKNAIVSSKKQRVPKDLPLNLRDALIASAAVKFDTENIITETPPSKRYKVKSNAYDADRIKTDDDLKELDDEFTKQIAADATVGIAYSVLFKFKTP